MSRPTKLEPGISRKICDSLRAGNYIETAAASSGISKSTLYEWLKAGARGNAEGKTNEFTEFSDAVEKAQADGEQRLVAIIALAAEKSWQAAAWHLERKNANKWGRRDTVNANVNLGKDTIREKQFDELFDELEQATPGTSGEGEPVDTTCPDPETGAGAATD